MNTKNKRLLFKGIGLIFAFVLWTLAVYLIDVRAIGPEGSCVGFASLNGFVHHLTGVHMSLYTITDWLGLVPVFTGLCFAVLGLAQWICRRNIAKVDISILCLGGFYLAVLAAYILFEHIRVNYRPVLIGGFLEASYPSSTTMLTMCVMPTAAMQLNVRIKNASFRRFSGITIYAFTAFVVVGRLISGVHWFSDIIGGVLLSAGLVTVYHAIISKAG